VRVSLLGIGVMGEALARALLKHGHNVTIWNRTKSKCEVVRQAGASVAAMPTEAADASDVIVVCLREYSGTRALLEPRRVIAALQGKLLVQLTTGTPAEARDLDAWATENGIAFLDGKILSSPVNIGSDTGIILFSGPAQLFETNKTLLAGLGAKPTYLGDRIGAASTLDMAALTYLYASSVGFMHAAAICESEDLQLSVFLSLLEDFGFLANVVKMLARMIERGDYHFQGWATIDTHDAAAAHIARLCRENGLDSALPQFLSRYFKRAMTAGHGGEELARLYQFLRNP
jgi:3-hydroxyisobutyrate dehydrogenase-like beta-hydroxyacid dehydrogenase